MSSEDNKKDPMEHHKWTKAERQYIKGIVDNYSLQRQTDQDIVDYLREEKKIKIARSTVTKIKNQVEQESEKQYIALRESGSNYSLSTKRGQISSICQKKLHEIMAL